METPPGKKLSPKSGKTDSSRRFWGNSGKNAEQRGESQEACRLEICSQTSRASHGPEIAVDEESEVNLARRRFIKNASGALAGALVLGKTAGIIGDLVVDEQGGWEAIQAKASRIQEGVTGGRLVEYVAERQRENFDRERLEQLRDVAKEVFQKTWHISLVFEENPHHFRPDREDLNSPLN